MRSHPQVLLLYHNPHLVCALHPAGPGGTCPDFRPDPDLEGKQFVDFLGIGEETTFENPYATNPNEPQWEPESASYYNRELILQPRQRWTLLAAARIVRHPPKF